MAWPLHVVYCRRRRSSSSAAILFSSFRVMVRASKRLLYKKPYQRKREMKRTDIVASSLDMAPFAVSLPFFNRKRVRIIAKPPRLRRYCFQWATPQSNAPRRRMADGCADNIGFGLACRVSDFTAGKGRAMSAIFGEYVATMQKHFADREYIWKAASPMSMRWCHYIENKYKFSDNEGRRWRLFPVGDSMTAMY